MHQPIHTLYGGAHLFKSTTCSKLSLLAQRSLPNLRPTAPRWSSFWHSGALAATVHARVTEKLRVRQLTIFASTSRTGSEFARKLKKTQRQIMPLGK